MERLGYALRLAYAGTHFAGFARQPGRRSVEGVLLEALRPSGVEATLAVAARTDAGVHARRQVVSFRLRRHLDLAVLNAALAAALPADVRLCQTTLVGRSFHARASARSRTYHFRMRVGGPPSLFWLRLPPGSYDWAAALALLRQQLGTKERSPFTTKPLQPKVTSLESVGLQPGRGGRCCAIFRGSGFTRHLVRNWMADALAVAQGEPVAGGSHYGHRGPPAPPEGLVLWEVDYGLQAPGLEAHVGAEQPLEGNVVRAADGHAGA